MIDRYLVDKTAASGHRKVTLLEVDPARYIARAVLAGMFLSIVVFVYWSLINDLPAPWGKVLGSAFFGVGLCIIVFTNTELFTSNNMYLAVSSSEGRTTWGKTAMLWAVCWLGNLCGALIVGGLLWGSGILDALPEGHALFAGAEHKVHQGMLAIFLKGILANWVVCLAVRLSMSMKEDIAKITIIILVVFIFLYLAFEHSIANMGTFTMSLLGHGEISAGEAAYNLLFATLGNIVGGAIFVGMPLRFVNPKSDGTEHTHH